MFVDPTGLIINGITNRQKQNSTDNKDVYMGARRTCQYNVKWNPTQKLTVKENTLGNYGCLFMSAVNIGNTERAKGITSHIPTSINIPAHAMAGNDKYFMFSQHKAEVLTDYGPLTFVGTNVATGSEQIKGLLKDMTGKNYFVDRIRDPEATLDLMKVWAEDVNYGAYFIAYVDGRSGEGHFINITGFEKNKNDGSYSMTYFDPYDRENDWEFFVEDIRGVYFIEDSLQHNERAAAQKEAFDSRQKDIYERYGGVTVR